MIPLVALLAAITPLRIIPNKIVYPVNESGLMTVVLTNKASDQATSTVKVEEIWGIEGASRCIHEAGISLAGHEGRTLKIPWPGSRERYGREIRVTTIVDGNPTGSRSEYFNVIDEWWRVNQGCGLSTARGVVTPGLKHMLDHYGYGTNDWHDCAGQMTHVAWERNMPGMGPFMGYHTMETRWQMQKSSVGGNFITTTYPDDMKWITPNGSAPRWTGKIRKDTRISHDWGFHHTRFTIYFMEGPYGFELARQKPEYMLRNARGQYEGRYMDVNTDPVKISVQDNPQHYPWTYVEPNFFREDAFDWAIDDLVTCVTALEEDGVYFDGRYMKKQGYDAFGNNLQKVYDRDLCVARNMEKTKAKIFDANPNAYIWSNGGSAADPELVIASHPQSGLLNEIQWPFLLNPSRSDHSYRGFLESLLKTRNATWFGGKYVKTPSKIMHCGYLATRWDAKFILEHRESFVMARHVMSIIASVCAHPFASSVVFRPFKQMMTRYSEFFWHEDMNIMKDGYKKFAADSLREIWYDDLIYIRETPNFTQYLIHLVNAPEQEFCDDTVIEEPPEADDVEVSTKLFAPGGVKAWTIKPHGFLSDVYEPSCIAVTPKEVKGETVFVVPPFRYYTLLVIRKYK